MLKMTEDLNKVLRYCKRWSVEVRFVKSRNELPVDSKTWFKSPLTHGGLEWAEQRIWVVDGPAEFPFQYGPAVLANILLHELAHCVAIEDPEAISEPYSEMLAFEYFSTRWLRLGGWTRWMKEYRIDIHEGLTQVRWQETSTRGRHKWLMESLTTARFYGILNSNGTPTFRRDHVEHL